MGKIWKPISLILLLFAVLVGAPQMAAAQIQAKTEIHGPVILGDGPDRAVMMEATYDELSGTPRDGWKRSLTRLRFRTQTESLLYQETLRTEAIVGVGFNGETVIGQILELRGSARRFLLLSLNSVPSTAVGGEDLFVYGFDRKGRFRRFGSAIDGLGARVKNPADRTGAVVLLREGKYLDVSEWTGNFMLVLPRTFNEEYEAFVLASACGKVEASPQKPAAATVTLYRTPQNTPGDLRLLRPFKTVNVTPASKIEFLEGCRLYSENHTGQYTIWMRVKIDGEDGWVPNEGLELDKLGLPTAD